MYPYLDVLTNFVDLYPQFYDLFSKNEHVRHELRIVIQKHGNESQDDYLEFLDPFLKVSNELELLDFEQCSRFIGLEAHSVFNDALKWN